MIVRANSIVPPQTYEILRGEFENATGKTKEQQFSLIIWSTMIFEIGKKVSNFRIFYGISGFFVIFQDF